LLGERSLQHNKDLIDLIVCFVDYEKAFIQIQMSFILRNLLLWLSIEVRRRTGAKDEEDGVKV